MTAQSASKIEKSVKWYLLGGMATVVFFLGGVVGLVATTGMSGAVIAAGTVVVDSSVKKIQHPYGGVIRAIAVREGDIVKKGDILVRLDEVVVRSNLALVSKEIDQLRARYSRLEADRDGLEQIAFDDTLVARQSEPEIAGLIAGERSIFDFQRESRAGLRAQLGKRVEQLEQEIAGLSQQREAKIRETGLIGKELEGVRELWDRKLISLDRLMGLERQAARLDGEGGQLTAAIAGAGGRISEIRLQMLQIDLNLRSEVAKELREVNARLSELSERLVGAQDQLNRIDIRSPQNGTVHQLSVHTIGGVISAGEVITDIVPVSDKLTVEAFVLPQDIDQLHIGQAASLRFSAFNQATTPEFKGTVESISPDLISDQRTGQHYFKLRVALPRAEVDKLGALALSPGMPAEVFLATAERTILSYLVKPIRDQMNRAFREE